MIEKVVTIYEDRVTKWFPREMRFGALQAEIRAYQTVPFATPRLLWATDDTICVERCTPILDVPRNRAHRAALWALLESIHAAGINHTDISLTNVVVHPSRGVLLIDWEASITTSCPTSYDLHGASAAGMSWRVAPTHPQPDGIWWGARRYASPVTHWR